MAYRDELESLGVNVVEGVDRVMGDEPLYEMMLGMFIDTVNENHISLEDFDAGDTEDLARRVHVLKGMTGNLSLTPVFDGYVEILGLLRGGKPKEAKVIMEKLLPVQAKIIECIQRNQA
ncbi:MAG: hypothetical protein NC400_07695 [Clostridium sp.]|nr:hypothetical protein [Clostridium sp.]